MYEHSRMMGSIFVTDFSFVLLKTSLRRWRTEVFAFEFILIEHRTVFDEQKCFHVS